MPATAHHIDVVVGGQYGSEGKGAVAGALVDTHHYDLLVRVAGPNAGHTTVDMHGVPRALRTIPAAGVRDHQALLYIGPGSEIDLDVLDDDLAVYRESKAPTHNRLWIHPQATVVTQRHRDQENRDDGFGASGSTRKGIGAARAARAMRLAPIVEDHRGEIEKRGIVVGEIYHPFRRAMLEGTQGYWLGVHAGMYPYCTSSDCRAVDFLAMSGLGWSTVQPWVVVRSFPIRIAGNSGPLESETTWSQIGVPAEFTTVTKKMRRVGQFEPDRMAAALEANQVGGVRPVVAFTFADYLADTQRDQERAARELMPTADIRYIGNGPASGFWPAPASVLATS